MSRKLERKDLPDLLALVEAANWNQSKSDWERLLDLCGKQAIGIEKDGRIVASATLLPHGKSAAWLGMVLTLPSERRQGFARQLLEELLAGAPAEQTIYLDATSQGQPLYQQLGFVEEGVVSRWLGRGSGESALGLGNADGVWNARLDEEAFGADRRPLLHSLAADSQGWQGDDGSYVLLRPGRLHSYLGPFVARNAASAAALAREALRGAGTLFWDILEENREAVQLASSLGFAPHRRLVRMRRGEMLPGKTALQFGIAGFEYG